MVRAHLMTPPPYGHVVLDQINETNKQKWTGFYLIFHQSKEGRFDIFHKNGDSFIYHHSWTTYDNDDGAVLMCERFNFALMWGKKMDICF